MSGPSGDPTGDVAALSGLSLAEIQGRLRPCRHCGLPTDGAGAVFTAPLEPNERPHPYRAHLACQGAALGRLAEAAHAAAERWALTTPGWLLAYRRLQAEAGR